MGSGHWARRFLYSPQMANGVQLIGRFIGRKGSSNSEYGVIVTKREKYVKPNVLWFWIMCPTATQANRRLAPPASNFQYQTLSVAMLRQDL